MRSACSEPPYVSRWAARRNRRSRSLFQDAQAGWHNFPRETTNECAVFNAQARLARTDVRYSIIVRRTETDFCAPASNYKQNMARIELGGDIKRDRTRL